MASNDTKPVAAKAAAVRGVAKPALAKAATTKPVAAKPSVSIAPPAAVPAVSLSKELPMTDTVKTVTDKSQAQAKAMFADAQDRTKGAMEKGAKMFEEMNDFGKGNVEAIVESSKIAAKGAEEIMKYTTDYARTAVEKANANASKFASLKSPTEIMKLQGDLAKEMMDSMMAEGAKFTEGYLKLLGEIARPVSSRVALAAEKIKIAA